MILDVSCMISSKSPVFETCSPTIHSKWHLMTYDTTTPQCRVLRSTPPLELLDIGKPGECSWVYLLKQNISQAAICTIVSHAACKILRYSDLKNPIYCIYVCISVTFASCPKSSIPRGAFSEYETTLAHHDHQSQSLQDMALSGCFICWIIISSKLIPCNLGTLPTGHDVFPGPRGLPRPFMGRRSRWWQCRRFLEASDTMRFLQRAVNSLRLKTGLQTCDVGKSLCLSEPWNKCIVYLQGNKICVQVHMHE